MALEYIRTYIRTYIHIVLRGNKEKGGEGGRRVGKIIIIMNR